MRAKENLEAAPQSQKGIYTVFVPQNYLLGSESFTTTVRSIIVYCISYIHIECQGTLKKKNKKQKEKKKRKGKLQQLKLYIHIFLEEMSRGLFHCTITTVPPMIT